MITIRKKSIDESRRIEFFVSIITIIITFILGFVCQEWVANKAANAYSNLAYTNSIVAVSDQIGQIDEVITSITVGFRQMPELADAVNQNSNDYKHNAISAGYWSVIQAANDRIPFLLDEIVSVSTIVKIPISNNKDYLNVQKSIDESIRALKVWSIEYYLRKEVIDNESEYKYLAISKCSYATDDYDYASMYSRYVDNRDTTEVTLKTGPYESISISKSDSMWMDYSKKTCVPALETLQDVFRDFCSLQLVSHKPSIIHRITQFPVATMAICILLLSVLFFIVYNYRIIVINNDSIENKNSRLSS